MAKRRKKGIPLIGKVGLAAAAGYGVWYFFIRKKTVQPPVQLPIVVRTIPNVPQSGEVIGITNVVPPSVVAGGRSGATPVYDPVTATQGKGGIAPSADISA